MKQHKTINPTQVRGRRVCKPKLVKDKISISSNNSAIPPKTQEFSDLHRQVFEQNLSDIPGGKNWILTSLLISNTEYDLARMSDDELEILAAGLPCGCGDE